MHLTQFFTNIPVPKRVAEPPALTRDAEFPIHGDNRPNH